MKFTPNSRDAQEQKLSKYGFYLEDEQGNVWRISASEDAGLRIMLTEPGDYRETNGGIAVLSQSGNVVEVRPAPRPRSN